MVAIGGFFNNASAKESKLEAASYINVGGDPFYALATAFIDQFKNSARIPDETMKKILERFYVAYPKYISNQAYLTTPAERMNMLINNIRTTELIDCLAQVLRHIAVTELLAHPLKYRDVFSCFSVEIPKEHLYHHNVQLPVSALRALSQALGITINLSFVEQEKVLRRKEVYANGSNFAVSIQVQGDSYYPLVKNKAEYAYVGQINVRKPSIPDANNKKNESLEDIFKLISEDNKRISTSFEQKQRTLTSMFDASEINKAQLLELYIKFLPMEDKPEQYFSDLETVEKKPVQLNSVPTSEQMIVKMLIANLAKWLSTGQVDSNKFFNAIDNFETKARSTMKMGQ